MAVVFVAIKKKCKIAEKASQLLFEAWEYVWVRLFAAGVIVNSKVLAEKFAYKDKLALLYYCSVLERIEVQNDVALPPALLYLGIFDEDKGADQVWTLFKELKKDFPALKLIVLGDLLYDIKPDDSVIVYERLAASQLIVVLTALLKDYYLIGLSLIKPVHYSYATQEANKDIDYLALGMPIIGNERLPTFEKLKAGCGVFYQDKMGIKNILVDQKIRAELAINCRRYYDKNYAYPLFRDKLLGLLKRI